MNPKHSDLAEQVKTFPLHSGVYQMLDAEKNVLYVGKAKQLRCRVQQYLNVGHRSIKIRKMMEKVSTIKIITTKSEHDALLLEYRLINKFKPRYNVVFRDDKSYLYIHLTADPFPRLHACRKKKVEAYDEEGTYFGPYTQVHQVHSTLVLLYRIFKLRQCDQYTFKSRHRPCLHYQTKHCSAPCVGLIDQSAYQQDLEYAKYFLRGKSDQVIQQLLTEMYQASQQFNYEYATTLHNQIRQLRQIQKGQL